MNIKPESENIPEVEVTPAMIEAALAAMEPFAFTSMEGYDMEKALAAAFRAMSEVAAKESDRRQ
jgi:hypothetical protein